MKYVDNTKMQLPLRTLSLLMCLVNVRAERYGDYSMPQYGVQYQDSDVRLERNDYNDRSPDAPARLDYKYEEEHREKSNEFSEEGDERIWDKRLKKKRKPVTSHNDHYIDLDKDIRDEIVSEYKTNRRYVKHKARVDNRNLVTEMHEKYNSIDQSDDVDDLGRKKDYNHKEVESDHSDDFEDFGHRLTMRREARRKARDRIPYRTEREKHSNTIILNEDMDALLNKNPYTKNKKIRKNDGFSETHNQNDDYTEYYDMKRVLKHRLPALYLPKTVRTTEAKSTYLEQWPMRRVDSLLENSVDHPVTSTTTPVITSTMPTTTFTTRTTKATETFSELSSAENSRLSTWKKALRRETSSNVSWSTKPKLMQVTRKMQTLVILEPRPTEEQALRSLEDSPERLQRARRLMRAKLMAGARSVHDLTDNWDEIVCDYIDVSQLDAGAAPSNKRYDCIIITMFVIICRRCLLDIV